MEGIFPILLNVVMMVSSSYASYCDKNLIEDLSFKLTGREINFPCASTKNVYISTGRYIPKNFIATRIQIYDDSAYVAVPRYRPGVPFSLAKFNLSSKSDKVVLEPFSCWNIQEEGNCEAIQNAIDLVVDPLDRLWVLDLGICNTLEQPVRRCQPKLWGFSLETGEVMKTINLESYVSADSRLQYLAIDFSSTGVPFAYISDAGTAAIIVLNLQLGGGFRVILPPALTNGCAVKDILYLQLVHKSTGNIVYINYLSSPRLFSIRAQLLQTGQTSDAIVDVGAKPEGRRQVFLGTDNGAAIFFRYKGESDIYIWNSDDPFNEANFLLVQKGGDCRLATQVVPGWKKLMWAIESNFHDFITGTTGCLGASVAVYPLVKTSD